MVIGKLAEKVLQKLGIFDRSGTDPADLQNVADAYALVYLELADDGLVTWAYSADDTADIPDRLALSLAAIIAAEIAGPSIPPPPEGWAKTKENAIKQIRRQLASGQPTETVIAEYF